MCAPLFLIIFAGEIPTVMTPRFFILVFCLFAGVLRSQTYQPFYGSVVAQCSQENISDKLQTFANFGVKYRGTQAQADALEWLKDQYESFGYAASQVVEDPYTYAGTTCKNLVVTKTGTVYPNTYVIICGHYDTVNGPGANDNGSGVAVILEAARLLQNIPTEYSIKFINFSGEEDGLIGSSHYVNAVVNGTTPKMDIRLVLNIDQVGGVAGETNNTITCERDLSNPTANNAASNVMTNQLVTCVNLYSNLNAVVSNAYGSDYVPFENNGEIITGLYETNESPYPHTPNDTFANMDPVFVYNVTQAAVGALLHFAVACTDCNLSAAQANFPQIVAWPNPANHELNISTELFAGKEISLSLCDVSGKTVLVKNATASATETIDVSSIADGIYVLTLESEGKQLRRKIVIQ